MKLTQVELRNKGKYIVETEQRVLAAPVALIDKHGRDFDIRVTKTRFAGQAADDSGLGSARSFENAAQPYQQVSNTRCNPPGVAEMSFKFASPIPQRMVNIIVE